MLYLSTLIGIRADGRSTKFAEVIARQPGQGGMVASAFGNLTASTEAGARDREGLVEVLFLLDNQQRNHLVFPDPEVEALREKKRQARVAAEEAAAQAALKQEVADTKAKLDALEKRQQKRLATPAPAVESPEKKKKAAPAPTAE